jgi:oleandomycin transport system ATP-binding protein
MNSQRPTGPILRTEALSRRFGSVDAVAGVDLEVPAGTVLGVLGPNGAGKTTTVRMLATLLPPTGGRAEIAGLDVVARAADVRGIIGLTGQYAAVDEHLTGLENLVLFGRLLGAGRREARRRADELLERFGLTEAGGRRAAGYSGGMRRRLDLAASLLGHPLVVFLDEPTTGLDPRSRLQLWDVVRELVDDGTTVFLTTQYLEEADELADDIVVIDRGTIVARGTADELKARVGGQVLELELTSERAAADAARLLAPITGAAPRVIGTSVQATANTPADVLAAVGVLDRSPLGLRSIEVHSPSLDDVFLTITGAGSDDLPSAA